MSRRGLGEYEPGRTGLSVSQLGDGQAVTVLCTGDVFLQETSESDDAIHQPCVVLDAPDGFTDMSGDPVETSADVDEPEEYNIINSSTAFYEALVRAGFQEGETDGQKLYIEASQEGDDQFSRKYSISAE